MNIQIKTSNIRLDIFHPVTTVPLSIHLSFYASGLCSPFLSPFFSCLLLPPSLFLSHCLPPSLALVPSGTIGSTQSLSGVCEIAFTPLTWRRWAFGCLYSTGFLTLPFPTNKQIVTVPVTPCRFEGY